jgi:3-deoxy-7-phosphoheptulonate synthase
LPPRKAGLGNPPLVFAGEARKLKKQLAQGRRGQGLPAAGRRLRRKLRRAFSADNIRDFFRVILQMAVVLTFAAGSRW